MDRAEMELALHRSNFSCMLAVPGPQAPAAFNTNFVDLLKKKVSYAALCKYNLSQKCPPELSEGSLLWKVRDSSVA